MKPGTHIHLLFRLKMNGAIHWIPLHALMVWRGTVVHLLSKVKTVIYKVKPPVMQLQYQYYYSKTKSF
jgi:hypothetical protein